MSNKDLSKKVQTIAKELGYDMKLGHAYELLSRLAGYNSWNVANAANLDLAEVVVRSADPVITEPSSSGLNEYNLEVRVSDVSVFKDYRIFAKSEEEAKQALDEYLKLRNGDIAHHEVQSPQAKALLRCEDEDQFQYRNWSVDGIPWECGVGEATLLNPAKQPSLGERLSQKDTVWCYWISEEYKSALGGYVPLVIIKDDTGFYPLRNTHWGTTLEEAMKVCDQTNQESLNLTHEQAEEIWYSTFHASTKKEARQMIRERWDL